jgi:hypothetical protein
LVAQPAILIATAPIAMIEIALVMLVYRKWLLAKSSKQMARKFFAVSFLKSFSCRIPVPASCRSESPAIDRLLFEQLVRKSGANKLSGAKPRRKQAHR